MYKTSITSHSIPLSQLNSKSSDKLTHLPNSSPKAIPNSSVQKHSALAYISQPKTLKTLSSASDAKMQKKQEVKIIDLSDCKRMRGYQWETPKLQALDGSENSNFNSNFTLKSYKGSSQVSAKGSRDRERTDKKSRVMQRIEGYKRKNRIIAQKVAKQGYKVSGIGVHSF